VKEKRSEKAANRGLPLKNCKNCYKNGAE